MQVYKTAESDWGMVANDSFAKVTVGVYFLRDWRRLLVAFGVNTMKIAQMLQPF